MGVKRMILRAKAVDHLASILAVTFVVSLISVNYYLSSHLTHKKNLSVHKSELVEETEPRHRGRRSAVDDWSIPAERYPVTLGVPWDCSQASVLTEFPNGTCFPYCSSGSCGTDIASIQSGGAELVCTAKIIQLGFRRSGTYDITRWIKQHQDVTYKLADMFIDSSGEVIFECPIPQLSDSSQAYHFDPYSLSSIGSDNMKNYYVHCESCLTTAYTDLYFGTLWVDLPTAMIPFFESGDQKFIVTLKNPTDRAIAEYFYPYILDGTDLDTVGGQTLHDAMSAAIDEVKACMTDNGPAACVYGAMGSTLPEAQMLYESCYYTHLYYVTQQIPISRMYFMQIEEYHANPESAISNLYSFLGLDYLGPIDMPVGTRIHKPILTDTVVMLDAFFSPFNTELSSLLGDSKWLYTRA